MSELERDSKGKFVKGSGSYWEGKKQPKEMRKKQSRAHKKLFKEGLNAPPSRKGATPWNKGVPMDEGVKQKVSLAKTGKSTASKGVPRHHLRDENASNWRGGTTKERRRQMSRIEYKEWRTNVFERDNYTCVLCGERGGKLQADHIKPWRGYVGLRYEVSNGRTLCCDCHRKTHTWGGVKRVNK